MKKKEKKERNDQSYGRISIADKPVRVHEYLLFHVVQKYVRTLKTEDVHSPFSVQDHQRKCLGQLLKLFKKGLLAKTNFISFQPDNSYI